MGKNQSASNLTNIIKQDASGSIAFMHGNTMLMSVSSSGAIATTGNVAGTASYASNAELFDGLDSTVFTLTSSFAAQTASFTAFTSSVNSFTASQNILNGTYATTGSNTFTGIQTVNSNLIVTGSITAQTLVVQTITSSVDFVTGSTRFGSISENTHQFTGSVSVSGSLSGTSALFTGSLRTDTGLGLKYGSFVSTSGYLNLFSALGGGSMILNIKDGTGGYESAISFSSTANRSYTFPSTNGTIALTSDLSSYLPLAGGTLTGALSGTSATFNNLFTIISNGGTKAVWATTRAFGVNRNFQIAVDEYAEGQFTITPSTTEGGSTYTTPIFRLNATGVATFLSSVTAASLTVGSLGSGSDAVISLATNASGSPRTIYYKASTAAINFTSTAGADLMSLTNGGSLGIGTTDPQYKTQITSTSANAVTNILALHNGSNAAGVGTGARLLFKLANFETSAETRKFASIEGLSTSSYNEDIALVFKTKSNNADPAERMRIFSNGIINTGGVTHQYFAGNVAGNASLTFTINCETMSSFRITCVMNHYGYISSYGCANMSLLANGPTQTVVTISDTQTGNGGSWSYAQVSHTQFTITKNAGTYGGGGNYFVEVVGNNSY